MGKEKTELEKVQDKVYETTIRVNEKIKILGEHLDVLQDKRMKNKV